MNAIAQIGNVVPLPQPRPMPHDIEVEQALLGACLTNAEAIDIVSPVITSSDFFDPVHGKIWSTIFAMRESGQAVTVALLRSTFGADAQADIAPGKTLGWYFSRLLSEATTVLGARDYAVSMRLIADRRRIILAASDAMDAAYSGIAKPVDIANAAIGSMDAMVTAESGENVKALSVGAAVDAAVERFEAIADRTAKPFSISWGVRSLNAYTVGLDAGDFVVIGGRPSMGKTTLGLSVALDMAREKQGVYFVSLEMTAQQLGQRAVAWRCFGRSTTPIVYQDIRAGNTDRDRREVIRAAADDIRGYPIVVEQEGGLTIGQITTRARRQVLAMQRAGTPMRVMVVDHLGIIRPSERYKGQRTHEVTEFTGALKSLAKELGIAVIALCQLNRATEGREDKRPALGDFRDSGSIEQDADIVIGAYRESYYLDRKANLTQEETEILVKCQHLMEAIFLKQRQGPTGTLQLFASMPCNYIADLQRG